ncbi:MAG: hypothetical protein OJJ55_08650 [Rhodococcus sp.]|jgi:hypothetical protein|uniref:hypothetical protein n=1 Tax=Rhodococcus TaxID=1827 RepID=UPI001AE07649|nr:MULTISPECIES: hypothetical protein [Rhodococcus]MCC4306131.1 hypothetical protein [Rhodococcus sp. 3-2]MCW0191361.1 hypothetical protein [Rhodococcus sp. (in: high G+C Gram-positive bacteria)]
MIESAPQLPEQRETLDGDALNHALAAMRTVLDGALAGVSGARDVLLATQAGGDFESGQGNGGEIALDLYLAHAAADLRTALSLIRDQLRDGL